MLGKHTTSNIHSQLFLVLLSVSFVEETFVAQAGLEVEVQARMTLNF